MTDELDVALLKCPGDVIGLRKASVADHLERHALSWGEEGMTAT